MHADAAVTGISRTPATAARNTIQPLADVVNLTLKSRAGQTANHLEGRNSSGVLQWAMSAAGALTLVSAALSGALTAASASVSGLGAFGSITSGSTIAATGALSGASATLTGALSAASATLSAGLTAATGAFSTSLTVGGNPVVRTAGLTSGAIPRATAASTLSDSALADSGSRLVLTSRNVSLNATALATEGMLYRNIPVGGADAVAHAFEVVTDVASLIPFDATYGLVITPEFTGTSASGNAGTHTAVRIAPLVRAGSENLNNLYGLRIQANPGAWVSSYTALYADGTIVTTSGAYASEFAVVGLWQVAASGEMTGTAKWVNDFDHTLSNFSYQNAHVVARVSSSTYKPAIGFNSGNSAGAAIYYNGLGDMRVRYSDGTDVGISTSGSGGSISGTAGTLAKFTSATALGDSLVSESGTTVTVSGALTATGKATAADLRVTSFTTQYSIPFTTNTSGDFGASTSLLFNSSTGTLQVENGSYSGTLLVAGVLTVQSNVSFTATTATIAANTSDGSDTKRIIIGGGGTAGSVSRGAFIGLYGNEFAGDSGSVILAAGEAGDIRLATGAGQTDRLIIAPTGATTISGTLTVGAALTLQSNVSFTGTTTTIAANTSDASDTKRIIIGGGGAAGSVSRGAFIGLYGNEFAGDAGYVILAAGEAGDIRIATGPSQTDRLTITPVGAATFSSTLTSTGLLTASSGISITGGSNAQGRIWKGSADGLILRGVTGTDNDFAIYSGDNGTIFRNPTGTRNVYVGNGSGTTYFPGAVSLSSTLQVTGITTLATTNLVGGSLTLDNGQSINGKNSGGTTRQLIVLQSDNTMDIGGTVDGGIRFMTALGNQCGIVAGSGKWSLGRSSATSDENLYVYGTVYVNAATVGIAFDIQNPAGNGGLRVRSGNNEANDGTEYIIQALTGTSGTRVFSVQAGGLTTVTGDLTVSGALSAGTVTYSSQNVSGSVYLVTSNSGQVVIGNSSALKSVRLEVQGGSGATAGILLSTSATDAANKEGRIKVQHYTNAEEPVTILFGRSINGSNELFIGGNSGVENAMNQIDFFTAANEVTTNGTRRGGFSASGAFDVVGVASCGAVFDVYGVGSASASNYERLRLQHDGAYGYIQVEAGGTGTQEGLRVQTGGSTRYQISTSGTIHAFTGSATFSSTLSATGSMSTSGTMTVGGAIQTYGGLVVGPGFGVTTGTDQYGLLVDSQHNSTATASIHGLYVRVQTQAATYTTPNVYTLRVASPSQGAAHTITTLYGLKIENQTAGVTSYAIHTGQGTVRFGDTVYADAEKLYIGGTSNNAVINANFSMYFNIDADNNGTEEFGWGHNAATTGSTRLMTLTPTDLTVQALITASSGISITGGSNAQGRIWKGSADGLILRGVTGTDNDFAIYSGDNGTIFRNPTGTRNVYVGNGSGTTYFPGAVSLSSTLQVTGATTLSSTLAVTGATTATGGIVFNGGGTNLNYYLSGSTTLSFTVGFLIGTPTTTLSYVRIGNAVICKMASWNSDNATGVNPSTSSGAAPAAIRPSSAAVYSVAEIVFAGFIEMGLIKIDTDGTVSLMRGGNLSWAVGSNNGLYRETGFSYTV